MDFEAGKTITIKNSAGKLKVRIEREISLKDVMQGIGDDKLPEFTSPRLEFHKKYYGDFLVTLFDQKNVFPADMYLFIIGMEYIKSYLGTIERNEHDDFDFHTCEVWIKNEL